MQRRYRLAHLILFGVVTSMLILLMLSVDAQGQIAFMSHRDGDPEIYVMNADGKNQRNRTKNPFTDRDPSWSLDGKRIAFASDRDGNWEIYTINADGRRDTRRLTNDVHDDMDPAWFAPAFAVEVAPFAVAPTGKRFTTWGWLKQADR